MVLGDPKEWRDRFISVDERLLVRIFQIWPHCASLLPGQPDEDTITINLVSLLSKDAVARRIFYFVGYQHEPFGTHPNGAKFSKGKIDMAVLLDQERERYVAYECKRLNVVNARARQSLATRYVKEGMMRFLTEQYAEGLPVGCMLGFVMDGDVPFALKQVHGAIDTEKVPLALISGPTPIADANIERFSTAHKRPSSIDIKLRHALLPWP